MKRLLIASCAAVLAAAAACSAFSGGDTSGPTTDADGSPVPEDAGASFTDGSADARATSPFKPAWVWTGGGPGNDFAVGALYNAGAPYFVGTVTGADSTLDAGGVPEAGANAVVVKMQDDGGLAWVHPHPNALGASLSADLNNVIYAGFSSFQDAGTGTDFAVEGLARANGASFAADYFGGPQGNHVILASAALPPSGAVFIGSTTGTGVLSSNGATYKAVGTEVVLVRTLGSAATVRGFTSLKATPFAAAADISTNLIVGGAFLNDIEIDKFKLTSADSTDEDGFLVKLFPDGGVAFVRQFGGLNRQQILGVACAADQIFVVGRFAGQLQVDDASLGPSPDSNLFVARFDPAGLMLWLKDLGPNTAQGFGARIAIDAQGNVIVGGQFLTAVTLGATTLKSVGGQDAFVAVLAAADGAPLAAFRIGGPGDDAIGGIAVGADGETYVAGSFTGSVDFGGTMRTAAGGSDIFFMKLVR